ncbi:hypothetical protein MIR68_005628 [Amoeboaphelidium protococcarum]|nr:hypothetical protein MIR68_005628 [Amoeboaphelidium protococcarum]KAI3648542.1 hypothetical protein MP228_006396 [Amoeboaphelidium protococcarum]
MTLLRDLLNHIPASTEISQDRTSTQLSVPRHPRELDDIELKLWKSFDQDVIFPYRIHIQPLLDMDCYIGINQRTVSVGSEAQVKHYLILRVFLIAEDIAKSLGGSVIHQDIGPAVGLHPDLILQYQGDPSRRCILPIEIKTMWAFDVDDDLVDFTNQEEIKKKVLRQEYGYMSVNHNRYGIICTADKFFFLRRGGSDGRQQSTLEVSSAVHRDQSAPFTLMEAVCAMFYLCENKDHCIFASPTPAMQPDYQVFDTSVVTHVGLHEVYFERVVGGSELYSVVFGGIHTTFRSDDNRQVEIRSHQLVLKMADSTKDPEHLKVYAIDQEHQCYLKLSRLQGTVIPRLLARLSIDGWIEAIMIERLERVSTVADIQAHYRQLRDSLQLIHQNGVAHGDVAPRNIMWKGDQLLFIDFGHAKLAIQMSYQEFSQMCNRDIKMLNEIAGVQEA